MNKYSENLIKYLQKNHPWLKVKAKVEDYVAPDYYDRLLKEYYFDGKSDLNFLRKELELIKNTHSPSILELGCGTGRASAVVIDNFKFLDYTLVDLSKFMIKRTTDKFSHLKNIQVIQSDTLDYLKNTERKFDFVFSLWSYSHSVYQMIERVSLDNALKNIQDIFFKFFTENMKKNSKLFLIHSDWLSDEQKILVKQWGKEFPDLYAHANQGISKITLDNIFGEMQKKSIIDWSVQNFVGDPIVYDSLEEAMEVFINFHLESYFNDTQYLLDVFKDVSAYLSGFVGADGKVRVKPACFIYRCLVS